MLLIATVIWTYDLCLRLLVGWICTALALGLGILVTHWTLESMNRSMDEYEDEL